MKKQKILAGALLCFAGGAMDGYSYVMRGGVLATAQTANVLLLGINLFEGNWRRGLQYLIPVSCFVIATYLSKLMYEKLFQKNTLRWERWIVFIELLAFSAVGFCDERIPSGFVNAVISFFAAMQYCAFRSFEENAPYATVFCTGNLRSLVDNVYEASVHKNKTSGKRAAGYIIMLASFGLGAGCCSLLIKVAGYHAIWLVCAALFIELVCMKKCSE